MKLIFNPAIFLFLFFLMQHCYAQTPQNKDCVRALPINEKGIFNIPFSEGEGEIINELTSFTSCLSNGERNNIWLKFIIAQSGLLGFKINPNNSVNDFDFALFNLSNANCSDIQFDNTLEVSCNFSGSTFPTPQTGLSNQNDGYPQINPMIVVETGESFYLLVNNYTSTSIGLIANIDFTESTCTFAPFSNVKGKAFLNVGLNCAYGLNDIPASNSFAGLVNTSTNQVYESATDEEGNFSIFYPSIAGSYQLEFNQNTALFNGCVFNPNLIENYGDYLLTENAEISLFRAELCNYIKITNRSSFQGVYSSKRYVVLQNLGTSTISNLELTLEYSTGISPNNVNYPHTLNNNQLKVAVPNIPVFGIDTVIINETYASGLEWTDEVCVEASINTPETCSTILDDDQFEVYYDCATNTIKVINLGNDSLSERLRIVILGDGSQYFSIDSVLAIGDSINLETGITFNTVSINFRNSSYDQIFEGKLDCSTNDTQRVFNRLLLPNRSYRYDCVRIPSTLSMEKVPSSNKEQYFYPNPCDGILFSKVIN